MQNPLRLIAGLTFDGDDNSDEPRLSAGEAVELFGDSLNPALINRRDRRDVVTHLARLTGTSTRTIDREAS